MSASSVQITAYIGAALWDNPGRGAAAVILIASDTAGKVLKRSELTRISERTTNMRAELAAIWLALHSLKAPTQLQIVTTSQYVIGVLNGSKRPKANLDLIHPIRDLLQTHTVHWQWMRSRDGHTFIGEAHQLAVQALSAESASA